MNGYYTKPFYQSQKWWAWLIGQGFALYAASQGLIDWQWVLAPALGFSLGQGLADLGKNRTAAEAVTSAVRPDSVLATPSAQPATAESECCLSAGEEASVSAEASAPLPQARVRFERDEFRNEVMIRAKAIYCEDAAAEWEGDKANWPGRFYASAAQLGMIPALSTAQVLCAWDEHLSIAEKAFEQLFGFPLDSARDHLADGECPARSVRSMVRQRGDAHYAVYLELVRVRIIVDELERIEARGLDWRSVLGTQISIYHVGERAGMVLEPDRYGNEDGRLVPRPGIGGASNMDW